MIAKAKPKKAVVAKAPKRSDSLATRKYVRKKIKEEAKRVNGDIGNLRDALLDLVKQVQRLELVIINTREMSAKPADRSSGTMASPAGPLSDRRKLGQRLHGSFESNFR